MMGTAGAKQAGDRTDGSTEIRKARKMAAVSMVLNLTLALGKGFAGVVSGSAALIGDAVHSATDGLGSIAGYVGLWLAGKTHPDFPYGLYKAETIATLVISVLVILAGYEIGRHAVLGEHAPPDVAIALPVAVVSLAIALAFGIFQLHTGKKLHSKALMADARDYLADGFSTAAVILGLVFTGLGIPLDRYAAGVVSLFVVWSGAQFLFTAVRDLMDESIDRKSEREIIDIVISHPMVDGVEEVLSRNAGGRFILDLDIVIRSGSHENAHRISHALETEIKRRFPRVVMVRIRSHPRESDYLRRITPLTQPNGEVKLHLGTAPWFQIEDIDRESGERLDVRFVQNPHADAASRRGYHVGKWLLSMQPDEIVASEDKEGTPILLLKEAGVKIVGQFKGEAE